ncbi:MAG: hypothetical protein LUE24_11670 [Lachnospiraceae bacterium]|nr:hypothetical protein [Lachnospiraceae bacterium]
MSYTPTTWSKGDIITAAKLNNLEEGLASTAETAENNATNVTQVLTSGTQIATINDVAIYAPSYTDGDEVSY